jgi:hypothetical protein
MLGLSDFFIALRDGSHAAADAASYCLGSLLWSAFFFMLGYLSALAVTAVRDNHLGRRKRDHT